MPFLQARGARLFFTDEGRGDTCLFVHRYTCDSHDWGCQLPWFADRFRVVALDLRGHGKSSTPAGGYEPRQLAGDVAALIRHLGCGPVVALGHSLGGVVVSALAVEYPDQVAAVVHADPAYHLPAGTPPPNFALLEAMHQAGMNVKVFLLNYVQPPDSFQNSMAKADAQGSWAPSPWVPTQLSTPETKAFVAALAKYQHFTSPPDQNVYAGWAAASALIKGLQVAGPNPTRASFIANLRKVSDFTADGLVAGTTSFTASFGTGAEGPGPYPGVCCYFEEYVGSSYTLPDPKPVCGGLIPNSNAG